MFKKLLEKLACKHKWYVHHQSDVYPVGDEQMLYLKHSIQTLICTKCGKIKKITL